MSAHGHRSTCPHSQMLRRGIPGLVGGVIDLAGAVLYGGTSVLRRIVDDAVWRQPGCGSGCGCDGGTVHHYRCSCVPPRPGGSCCC